MLGIIIAGMVILVLLTIFVYGLAQLLEGVDKTIEYFSTKAIRQNIILLGKQKIVFSTLW